MNDSVEQSQTSWKERRQQQLREEFVGVALSMFREKGIDATSVDDIVQAAGVAKGTFYLYFKAKADVIKEALDTVFCEMDACVADAINSAPEDARVKLKAVVRTHIAFIQANKGMGPMLLAGRGTLPSDLPPAMAQDIRARSIAATISVYERIIRTGMLQTHFREVDAGLAAHALQGILTGLVYDAMDSGASFEGIYAAALDFFENGIRRSA